MAEQVTIHVDEKILQFPSGITIKMALELGGWKGTKFLDKGALFAPCEVGGCWSCTVVVEGEPRPAFGDICCASLFLTHKINFSKLLSIKNNIL
jgi:hypothetical protein